MQLIVKRMRQFQPIKVAKRRANLALLHYIGSKAMPIIYVNVLRRSGFIETERCESK